VFVKSDFVAVTTDKRKEKTTMKTKNLWKPISIVVIALLLFVAVGTVLGQEPEPPAAEGEEEEDARIEGEMDIVAYPARTMNYQGYLTDGSGNPLDGDYDMVFGLWSAETGGLRRWGDETHNDVPVSDGLFSVALGETMPLDPKDFDEQLYLEITVSGTTLPRQTLRAAPYAMGLMIGSRVRGATGSVTDYSLYVDNENGRGIYSRATTSSESYYALYASNTVGRGIYANAGSNDLYSLYSADITYSGGGYAGPDTYVFVPTLNAILPHNATGEHLAPQGSHYMRVDADSSGTGTVYVPIQIERPYGRDYVVKEARVYYRVNEASITWAGIMGMNFTNGGQTTIGSDSSDHTSPTASYFDIDATNYCTVTTTMAPTGVSFNFSMDNDFGYVDLYGVRLRLDSDY
jgi:hypothetical protein